MTYNTTYCRATNRTQSTTVGQYGATQSTDTGTNGSITTTV